MGKPKNVGSRSNFSLMPFEIRFKICCMLHDGATTDAVASEAEVKAAYARIGSRLNRNGVMGIKRCAEYKKICSTLEKERLDAETDRLTSAVLKETRSAETISETLQVELLRAMSDLSDLSDVSDGSDRIKAVRSLAQSMAALNNGVKDRLKAENTELKAEIARLEIEFKEMLARKETEISELNAKLAKFGSENSGAVINEMDQFVKGESW